MQTQEKEEFKLRQKIEDMICYGNQVLLKYPKAERYALVAEMKRSMYTLYRLAIAANKRYYKKNTLQEMDVELEVLRGFLRLSVNKELRYVSLHQYEQWAKKLNEIGCMLGGWIKSTKQ